MLTVREAAAYVGLAKSTLDKMRTHGDGPKFLKLGRVVRYLASDLDEWMRERRCSNTSPLKAA